MGRATLQTIADAVGVSRMTVSNAFSRPDQLSAELRAKVLLTAERLGYAGPNPSARALVRGTVGNVGLLLSDTLSYALTDHVANAFLAAVAEELGPTGRALTLLPTSESPDYVPARDIAMDGAVVYSCVPDSEAVRWLVRRGIPLVFVDNEPRPQYPSVNIDDRGGARAAAQHLLDLGHRNIAIVTATSDDGTDAGLAFNARERLRGWTRALTEAGVEPTVIGLPHRNPVESGLEAGRRLFSADLSGAPPSGPPPLGPPSLGPPPLGPPSLGHQPQPTGVLCYSDAMASGILRAAREAGLAVPRDVSVVGFDDNPLAQYVSPELTTVRQDVSAKGKAAAAAVIHQIDGDIKPRKRVVLPTELVVRASTAPPPRRTTARRRSRRR
jgi:DNA-binding LacI/PurR family transcriptional regulator